mgnify:CR=1 FL=1
MTKNIIDGKLPPELIEILVCPKTKQKLEYNSQTNQLVSVKAGLSYPVRNGIPILLIEEAQKL